MIGALMIIKNDEKSPVVPDLFDARLRRRNLSRGYITHADVKKHEATLRDETPNASFVGFGEIVETKVVIKEEPKVVVKAEPVEAPKPKRVFEIPALIPAIDTPMVGLINIPKGDSDTNNGSDN